MCFMYLRRYLRRENFDIAMDIAKRTSKEAVQKVMLAQAEHMFYARNFIAMENLLLRAEKPEHAVNLYKVCTKKDMVDLKMASINYDNFLDILCSTQACGMKLSVFAKTVAHISWNNCKESLTRLMQS